jgi:cyclopropane fatty-acyl-phospholipid synthase-like methyltransferase
MSETTRSETRPISEAFDALTPIVDAVNDGAFHLAYWYDESDDASIAEAGRRVTRKVLSALGIRAGEHLLDVGCGPGAPAVLMASESGARVTGVAISNEEVSHARRRAAAAGLSGQVEFRQADYMALPYPDASFDGVVAIEALLGAPDLPAALGELRRVLRPGGRFAFCHCTKEVALEDGQMTRFNSSTWGSDLPTLSQWLDVIRSGGFDVEEYSQFGPRVLGQKERYHEALAARRTELLSTAGEDAVNRFEQSMAGFFAPAAGTIGYALIAGRRSRD